MTSIYRINLEKSVFMKHWETESFSGTHGCAEQFRVHLMKMSFPRAFLGFVFWLDTHAWCGESVECWAHFLISAPSCDGERFLKMGCGWGPWCCTARGALSSWGSGWEIGRGSKAFSVPSFPDKSTPCSGLFLGVIFWVISCSCTICLNLQMKQYLKEIGAVSIHLCRV